MTCQQSQGGLRQCRCYHHGLTRRFGEQLFPDRAFHHASIATHPVSPPRQVSFDIWHDGPIRCDDEANHIIFVPDNPGYNASPLQTVASAYDFSFLRLVESAAGGLWLMSVIQVVTVAYQVGFQQDFCATSGDAVDSVAPVIPDLFQVCRRAVCRPLCRRLLGLEPMCARRHDNLVRLLFTRRILAEDFAQLVRGQVGQIV